MIPLRITKNGITYTFDKVLEHAITYDGQTGGRGHRYLLRIEGREHVIWMNLEENEKVLWYEIESE